MNLENIPSPSTSDARFKDKVALIFGGSTGIGHAVAEGLAAGGAHVSITFSGHAEEARTFVRDVETRGARALALPADLTDLKTVRRAFDETIAAFGRLDLLVISGSAPVLDKTVLDTTEEDFDRVFAFNARGNFFTLQEGARRLADGGRIVTFSTPYTAQPTPQRALTGGSKAAVDQFAQTLAREIGRRGITVNAVMPGPTQTPGFDRAVPSEQARQGIEQASPLGRVAEAREVAAAALFLLSAEASYVNGHVLRATGGMV